MDNLVSIVVPIYNVEQYLDNTIESVLKQSYINIELVLIDDGSKDNSFTICKSWQEKDKRIKVFTQANSGVSVARNNGIDKVEGDYILFLDSDDYLELDAVEKLMLEVPKEQELIVFGYYTHDVNNRITRTPNYNETKTISIQHVANHFWNYYKDGITNSPVNKIYQTKIIRENNIKFPPNIRMGEDLMFNLEYFKHIDNIKILNQTFYHYITHENQATAKVDLNISDDMIPYLTVIKRFIESFGSHNAIKQSDYFYYVFRHLLTAIEMAYLDGTMETDQILKYIKEMIEKFNKNFNIYFLIAHNHYEKKILSYIQESQYHRIHFVNKNKYRLKNFVKRVIK